MATSNSFDLSALMAQSSEQMGLIDSTVQQLSSLTDQGSKVSDVMVDAIRNGTDARGETALSLQTRKLGELEAQQKKAEFYKAIGMDGEGQAKLSSFLADQFQQNTRQAIEQAASIQERESVGLLDNPLAYVWNQLILPDEKNALDATVKKGEIIKNSLNELNIALDQTAKNETEYSTKITAASVDSQVQGLKSNIDAQAAQAQMQAIQSNAHNLVTVMNANKAKSDMIGQIIVARNSAEHLQLSREAAGRERVRFNQWQQEVKDTEDYIDTVTALANDTAKLLGKPELDRRQVALAMKGKAQPGMAEMIQAYAQTGYINKNSGALGDKFGETATAALDFAVKTKTPIPQTVSEILSKASEFVKAEVLANKIDGKNKQLVDAEMNKQVERITRESMANIDSRDGTNPYRVPDIKVIAATEAVKNTVLFREVLSTQIAAGGLTSSDPAVIYAKGMEAVKQGKITLGQLGQDIVTFYQKGIQANNVEKQFNRFGMPEQTTYKASIPVLAELAVEPGSVKQLFVNANPFSGYTQVVKDHTDLVQVNELLVKMAAVDRGLGAFGPDGSLRQAWVKAK